jgi:hypothetical protein
MDDPAPNTALSDEELQAALAQAAALSAQLSPPKEASQDEDNPVVPIPVPPPFVPPLSADQNAAQYPPAAQQGAPVPPDHPPAGTTRYKPGLMSRFASLFGRERRKAAQPGGTKGTVIQLARYPNLFLSLLDLLLELLNRPFAFLGTRARRVLGYASITTIIISLAAGLLFPRLFPRQDAISFIATKKAQLSSPVPEKTPASAPHH